MLRMMFFSVTDTADSEKNRFLATAVEPMTIQLHFEMLYNRDVRIKLLRAWTAALNVRQFKLNYFISCEARTFFHKFT